MISNWCLHGNVHAHFAFEYDVESLSLFTHVEEDGILWSLLKFDVLHDGQHRFLAALSKLINKEFVSNQEPIEILCISWSTKGSWHAERFGNGTLHRHVMRCVQRRVEKGGKEVSGGLELLCLQVPAVEL